MLIIIKTNYVNYYQTATGGVGTRYIGGAQRSSRVGLALQCSPITPRLVLIKQIINNSLYIRCLLFDA